MENPNKPSKSSKEYTFLQQDMKCLSSEGSSDRQKLMIESQSDAEAEALLCKRKRSNRVKRYKSVTTNASSSLTVANTPPSISDDVIDQQEQEEVALSLIILSGNKGSWGGPTSPDTTSLELKEIAKSLKFKKQSVPIPRNELKKRKSQVSVDETNKSVFECSVCKKGFQSYQALGGHRASHKKFNGCCAPRSEGFSLETESSGNKSDHRKLISRVHECPICFKVFPSGQALGGHKRSHLAAKNSPLLENDQKPVCENRVFLDLNLPAIGDDEENECSRLKAWWFEGGQKAELLLDLISS